MAIKKVDRHVLWGIKAQAFKFTNTLNEDTTGKAITANLLTEAQAEAGTAGTKVNGAETGAAIGTDINLTFDLSLVTAGKWHELKIEANKGLSTNIGMLPNPGTANKIMIYIIPVLA